MPLTADAQIVDVQSKKVIYLKNGEQFKTTVRFSDGFSFITHATSRSNLGSSAGRIRYQISVNDVLLQHIQESAMRAHQKAYEKQQAGK